jgi:hypothetical protein
MLQQHIDDTTITSKCVLIPAIYLPPSRWDVTCCEKPRYETPGVQPPGRGRCLYTKQTPYLDTSDIILDLDVKPQQIGTQTVQWWVPIACPPPSGPDAVMHTSVQAAVSIQPLVLKYQQSSSTPGCQLMQSVIEWCDLYRQQLLIMICIITQDPACVLPAWVSTAYWAMMWSSATHPCVIAWNFMQKVGVQCSSLTVMMTPIGGTRHLVQTPTECVDRVILVSCMVLCVLTRTCQLCGFAVP